MADEFNPATHEYFRDGKRVFSCTQILGLYFPQTGPVTPREHARRRGDEVHRLIEEIEAGGAVDEYRPPEGVVAEQVLGRLNAWNLFKREVKISKMVMEYWRIAKVDSYLYGVTPDILCEMHGRPCVIECKNTYSAEVSHRIQTAAQVLACETDNLKEWLRFALYLKGDGTYKLKPHTDLSDYRRWRTFLAAHEEARLLKGK